MLNRTTLINLSKQLETIKATLHALENQGIKAYHYNRKERPEPAQNAEILDWMGESINALFGQLQALAEWHKDATKHQRPKAVDNRPPRFNYGDYWAWLERDLYAISERLELEANSKQERAERYYNVANQLHALNITDDNSELTERQKEAFFSLVESDYRTVKFMDSITQQRPKSKRG